jgi:FkbM family methyltransferase
MGSLKRNFKKNTHNALLKGLASFGRSMNRLYENRNHDLYSNGELTVIKKLATIHPVTIVDGGANIGKYSLMLHQHIPNASIFAFEPVTSTFDQLKEQVKDHQKIIPIHKGLFSENCTKEINLFKSHTHSSFYNVYKEPHPSGNTTQIELVKGDDWMKENQLEQIDFLKLDLEGAEFDAIKGFENGFRTGKIKAVQFEYGPINILSKKLLIDFYAFFIEHGYVLGKIFPKIVEFREYEFKHEDFIGPNFIAINKDETKLIQLLAKK